MAGRNRGRRRARRRGDSAPRGSGSSAWSDRRVAVIGLWVATASLVFGAGQFTTSVLALNPSQSSPVASQAPTTGGRECRRANEADSWFQVEWPHGHTGFISARYVRHAAGALEGLLVC